MKGSAGAGAGGLNRRDRGLIVAALVVAVGVGLGVAVLVKGRSDPRPEPRQAICNVAPDDGQAAIAAAIRGCRDGSVVRFPRDAVYHQSGRIEVYDRNKLVIDGNGSSFLSNVPNIDGIQPNWLLLRGHDITFENMTVRGNFTPPGPRSPMQVGQMAANQANAGFYVAGGEAVTIRDVTVQDVFGDFVLVTGSGVIDGAGPADGELPSGVRVTRLHGNRSARHGVALTVGSHLTVEGSTFTDNWYGGVDAEIDVPGEPLKDVVVADNTFEGYHFFAVAVPAPGNDGDVDGVAVRDNRMLTPADLETCGVPILIGYYENSPYMANVHIERNQITSQTHGVSVRQVASGAIKDNRVELIAAPSVCGADGPVKAINSPNLEISGNTIAPR